MKKELKRKLEMTFEAPEPKRKREFIQRMEQPRISTISFMFSQIFYIRKSVWLLFVLVMSCAIMCAYYIGQDCVWAISAMMPIFALSAITENARSTAYGMAELEMTTRFSLKSITLARLSAIGMLHFLLLFLLVIGVGKKALLPYIQVGIYLLVPYLLTSVLGMMAIRKMRGKESAYACVSIAVMVSFLHLILKANIPRAYEEKQFIWWCVFAAYLIVKACIEWKKTIYLTEDLAWN